MRTIWKQSLAGLLSILTLAAVQTYGQEAPSTASSVHEIPMTCQKYEFLPNTLHVKKGERVRLLITCTDRDHGIKLEAFHVEQRLNKEAPTPVEFTADKAGTFTFKCSVFCGMGHRHMKGQLIVEE